MGVSGPASEAYGAFAYAYDKGLGERFFGAVRGVLSDSLERYPTAKRTHLDIACGTGLAGAFFRERGWTSVGVDASLPMLAVARKRVPRLVAADMRALPFRRTFARITCLYDSLNHLTEREDLIEAFRSARRAMSEDSLFLFDMNHPEIYPLVWGLSDPFVAAGREYRLEIATSYRKREKLGRAAVTGWAKVDGRKVEIHEQHQQRAYSEKEIVSALAEAKLAPLDVVDFDPYGEAEAVEAPTVKLFFVARPT